MSKDFHSGRGPDEHKGPRRFVRRPRPEVASRPQGPRPSSQAPRTGPKAVAPAQATGWNQAADWYDKLVGDEGSEYQREVVLPAAVRMLALGPSDRVLDLCCGPGVFARLIAPQVKEVVGVDSSPAMIQAARQRGAPPSVRYELADAANLGALADGSFDAAACLLALHDLGDLGAVLGSLAEALRIGGRVVVIIMHPCFRIPRQSSWGWDEKLGTQYRRLDRYISPLEIPIATHPGSDPSQHTVFYHRPVEAYLNAIASAGLALAACEELTSHRQSEPGSRSRAENRSRREFPLFLALKAVRIR